MHKLRLFCKGWGEGQTLKWLVLCLMTVLSVKYTVEMEWCVN